MAKLTELQEMRLPLLEAQAKNRAKTGSKTQAATEASLSKKLRRLNRAIWTLGLTTKKEMTAAKKELDELEVRDS